MNDDALLREFLIEADELLESLRRDGRELRAGYRDGRTRRELLARIFRYVHTLKGSAAGAELEAVGGVAHEFESLLEEARMGRLSIDEAALDLFDDTIETLATLLKHVEVKGDGDAAAQNEREVAPTISRLQTFVAQRNKETTPRTVPPTDNLATALSLLPTDISDTLSEYERHRLREALDEQAALFLVAADFDLMTFDEGFRALSERLSEHGETIATLPGMSGISADKISFRIIYTSHRSHDELNEQTTAHAAQITQLTFPDEQPQINGEATSDTLAPASTPLSQSFSPPDVETETLPSETPPSNANATNASSSQPSAASSLVRVPLAELDDLVSLTHELFGDTVAAFDHALTVDLARAERTEIEMRAARIRRRFAELEERLVALRMIPLEASLERAVRAGEAAARSASKQVDFTIEGADVRLDKSLADQIVEPLLHILRNAVDHGIEPAEARVAAGKTERGQIRLAAFAEGSRVRVQVTDDGAGIDLERVRRKAIARGLLAPNARASEQEILRFIFAAGFSTADNVSSVSGRGVGLDAVERAVREAGGDVRVHSSRSAGTTFDLLLPTTLALVPALVARADAQHRYCIHANHIVETGYVRGTDISHAGGGAWVARWRERLIPLVHLRSLLGEETLEDFTTRERWSVVIAPVGGDLNGDTDMDFVASETRGSNQEQSASANEPSRIAVAVEGWDGHREVLVRGLGRHASRWRGVSGATELADGSVALMLDLPGLLESYS